METDFSIGTDIEDISRFDKYAKDQNEPFVQRIFTENEIEYCFSFKNPAPHLAVRFSAKEAVYKALCSLGLANIEFSQIKIFNEKNGVPKVRLLKEVAENLDFRLSLSHGNGNSLASVFVIKR